MYLEHKYHNTAFMSKSLNGKFTHQQGVRAMHVCRIVFKSTCIDTQNEGVVNEKFLWHGTASLDPLEVSRTRTLYLYTYFTRALHVQLAAHKTTSGFDMRFCSGGFYGRECVWV